MFGERLVPDVHVSHLHPTSSRKQCKTSRIRGTFIFYSQVCNFLNLGFR